MAGPTYQDAEDRPKGSQMDRGALKALLDSEKVSALAAMQSSKLSSERDDALMYYMNDMSKDMPAQDGRSSAVSSDVADTIEGMLPYLVDIFAGSEEVIKFNPVGPEDVQAAEQETDYVNHVFMNQNPGFLVLYSFIKDALLSKVGVVKAWWEEREEEEKETYYDLTDDEFAVLAADEDVTITKHTEHHGEHEADQPRSRRGGAFDRFGGAAGTDVQGGGQFGGEPTPSIGQFAGPGGGQPGGEGIPGGQVNNQLQPPAPAPGQAAAGGVSPAPLGPPPTLHDVEVRKSKNFAEAKVLGVPPEEFGIEKTARSIRTCNYCFHRITQVTQGELIRQGYDEAIIKSLPTYLAITNAEEINRDTVAEHQNVGEEHNPASRRVAIIEHYVRMDYEGDGYAKLYKVTTGDEQGVLLTKDGGKLDLEEIDQIPFAAMTPVIVTHRFFGRSIADLVMDIQRIKTALLRAMLDNQYLANNPRVVVDENGAGDNTLDDLLISRPGGIVRVKSPTAIQWQEVPTISNNVMPLLEYEDSTREQRTGVSRAGQALDPKSLQNSPADAASQMFTMAQARMKLVARIFAETGVKDLFILLHGLIRKHGQEAQTVRLRNQWIQVDPRDWKKRNDMTVEVGLGTGGKAEQMAMVNLIIGMQEKALMGGLTNLVTAANLYNSAKALTRIAGHKDVDAFFTDPSTQPPPQPQQDPKIIVAQMQAQLQDKKQQTDAVHEQAKMQADAALEQQKFQHEKELAYIELGMKREEHQQKMHQSAVEHDHKVTEAKLGMVQDQHEHELGMQQGSVEHAQKLVQGEQTHGNKMAEGEMKVHTAGAKAGVKPKPGMKPSIFEEMRDHLKAINAPKRIVRDKMGRITHLETMT